MLVVRERNLQLIRNIPTEINSMAVYGDQIRIQQVLAEFLLSIVRYAPMEGSVEFHLRPVLKQMADGFSAIRLEFRYLPSFWFCLSNSIFS